MGLFSWMTGKGKASPVPEAKTTAAQLLDEIYGGWESSTGVPVTWRQALQISTVLACIRTIANGVSQVPFVLFKNDGRMNRRAVEHPLYSLLHDAPNDFQSSFDFRFTLALHLTLTNNALVWINRIGDRIIELLPIEPGKWCMVKDGWDAQYLVTGKSGRQYTLTRADVWHIRSMSFDGLEGIDAVRLARDVLGLTAGVEHYGAKFFKGGGKPQGILSTAATLDAEQRKGLRQDWEVMNAGMQNQNRIAVLWGDLKYIPVGAANDQNQFLETRKLQIEEICRAFGVQPLMVYYSDKNSTYASVEQMFIMHVTHTLNPLYANIEQGAVMALLTEQERLAGYYIKLISNGLLRGATKDRAEFYRIMRTIGAITINEIREFEELNPVEGGDDPFAPLNSNVSPTAKAGSEAGNE